jgi:hypothetical protein
VRVVGLGGEDEAEGAGCILLLMIRSFGGLEDEEVEEGRGMMARLAGRCRLGRGGIRLGRGGSRGLGVGGEGVVGLGGLGVGLVGILSSCLGKEGMDGYGLLSGMGWCEVLAFRLTVGVDGGGDGCPLRNLEEADDGTQTVDSRLGMQ